MIYKRQGHYFVIYLRYAWSLEGRQRARKLEMWPVDAFARQRGRHASGIAAMMRH